MIQKKGLNPLLKKIKLPYYLSIPGIGDIVAVLLQGGCKTKENKSTEDVQRIPKTQYVGKGMILKTLRRKVKDLTDGKMGVYNISQKFKNLILIFKKCHRLVWIRYMIFKVWVKNDKTPPLGVL